MSTTWTVSYAKSGERKETKILGVDQRSFFYGRQNVRDCEYPINDVNLSGTYHPVSMKRRMEEIDKVLELRRVIIHRLEKRRRLPFAKIDYLFAKTRELCGLTILDDDVDWEDLGRSLKRGDINLCQFKYTLRNALGRWHQGWFHDAWKFDALITERDFLRDILTFLGPSPPPIVKLESSNFPDFM